MQSVASQQRCLASEPTRGIHHALLVMSLFQLAPVLQIHCQMLHWRLKYCMTERAWDWSCAVHNCLTPSWCSQMQSLSQAHQSNKLSVKCFLAKLSSPAYFWQCSHTFEHLFYIPGSKCQAYQTSISKSTNPKHITRLPVCMVSTNKMMYNSIINTFRIDNTD